METKAQKSKEKQRAVRLESEMVDEGHDRTELGAAKTPGKGVEELAQEEDPRLEYRILDPRLK